MIYYSHSNLISYKRRQATHFYDQIKTKPKRVMDKNRRRHDGVLRVKKKYDVLYY